MSRNGAESLVVGELGLRCRGEGRGWGDETELRGCRPPRRLGGGGLGHCPPGSRGMGASGVEANAQATSVICDSLIEEI